MRKQRYIIPTKLVDFIKNILKLIYERPLIGYAYKSNNPSGNSTCTIFFA